MAPLDRRRDNQTDQTDVLGEHREFLERLAEQDHLRISKYAQAMLAEGEGR